MGKSLALAALCATCGGSALAQGAPLTHASVELIADPDSAQAPTLWVGVLFHLDPGWHIYWQNPGDSGTPPKIQWNLGADYRAGAIRWPTPVRLGSGSVIDYGYENQVLLMAPIRAIHAGASRAGGVGADVRYVVCREVCIPGKAEAVLAFASVGDDPPAIRQKWRELFREARAQLPKAPPASWKLLVTQDTEHFRLVMRGADGVSAASFLPFEPDQIENSTAQVFAGGQSGFTLTLKKSDQLVKPISTLRGLLVLGPGRSYEIEAPVTR